MLVGAGTPLAFVAEALAPHGHTGGEEASQLDDDDKRNFSKGLSAFANSDGGVLVWGLVHVTAPVISRSYTSVNACHCVRNRVWIVC
jgi:predicted HTH transcriptional regulator